MGAQSGGSWGTFLMSVPLAAIPLMAIFGIPQFAPVAASPDDEEVSHGEARSERDIHDRYRRRSSDLLSGFDDRERTERLSDAPIYDPFREDTAPTREPADMPGPRRRIAGPTDVPVAMADDRTRATPLVPNGGRAEEQRDSDWLNATDATAEHATVPTSVRTAVNGAADEAAQLTETGGREGESAAPLTWREAARELSDRGIDNFRLERGHDAESFLFVCTLAPGDAPHVTMRFEAEAIEPLAAVSSVLDQVDVWLRGRFAATQGYPAGSSETP
jgi:hypothetical protein